ncbi:MAG: DUF4405 domain-containing protein [Candidatus Omnitrophica bacterium]|nr:DUF4405 domain-containing protein [Candidatus Omnitrophota bacterium]
MNKVKLLKAVNFVLFLLFIVQGLTAIGMFFDVNIVNLRYVELVHKCNGLLVIMLIVTHITLNWAWLNSTYFKNA